MRKNLLKGILTALFVAALVIGMAGCENPGSPTGGSDATITIAAITGVTAPVAKASPVTAITANEQYTGTVTWNSNPATFAHDTAYTATITLTPKEGYTLQGVAANFFTVAGATATNAANSGVITAVFPKTGTGGGDDGDSDTYGDATITIAAIAGVTAPVALATPVTAITASDQYTGTVTWNGDPAAFAYDTIYTATITLTAKDGFTLTGVAANFFTVEGATATNAANSGVITAEFPQTAGDPGLPLLSGNITISPNSNVKAHTELTANYTGGESVTYQWKKDVTSTVGTGSNKYTPTDAGSYTVTVSATGYQSKSSAAVVVSLADLAGDVTISPNTDVDTGMELTATYSGSETAVLSYQWKNGTNNVGTDSNKFTPSLPGSYTVTVSAGGYNPKTNASAVTVTGILAGNLTITMNPTSGDLAEEGSVLLTAVYDGAEVDQSDLHYQWEFEGDEVGDDDPEYTADEVGYYTVTISAEGYHDKTMTEGDEVEVIDSTLPYLEGYVTITHGGVGNYVETGTVLTAEYDGSDVLESALHYHWERDGTHVGTDSKTLTASAAGTYWVIVTAEGYNPEESDNEITVYQLLDPPANIHAAYSSDSSPYQTSIDVSFDAVVGANGYNLYVSTTETGEYTLVSNGGMTTHRHSIWAVLKPVFGESYWYKVSTYINVGYDTKEGAQSDAVKFEPVIPPLPLHEVVEGEFPAGGGSDWYQFTAVEGTKYWFLPLGPSDGFPLIPSLSLFTSAGTNINISSGASYDADNNYWYAFTATAAQAGTVYVQVLSYDENGGTYGFLYNTTGIKPLTPPATINNTSDLPWVVQLEWPSVTGATSYEVHRSDSESGPYTKLDEPTAANYTDATVSAGATYYYKVRSKSATETSSLSAAHSFTIATIPALTADEWTGDKLFSRSTVSWYQFAVTSGQTYYLHGIVSDRAAQSIGISGYAYYSDGTSAYTDSATMNFDSTTGRGKFNFIAASSGTVYIQLEPNVYWDGTDSAMFNLAYSQIAAPPPLPGMVATIINSYWMYDGAQYATLREAIQAYSNSTIYIWEDIEVSSTITVGSGTLVAAKDGVTISAASNFSDSRVLNVTGSLTLGSGTHGPVLTIDGGGSYTLVYGNAGCTLTLKSGVELRNANRGVETTGLNADGSRSTFNMTGGVIGGCYIGAYFNYTTINMTGGIIYGTDAADPADKAGYRSVASTSTGVYVAANSIIEITDTGDGATRTIGTTP